jgi:arylsulfatase A-like enzyme
VGAAIPLREHLEAAEAGRVSRGRRIGVVVVAVAAVTVAGAIAMIERGAPTTGPRWNVVVILTDDQTADSLPREPSVMPFLQAAAGDPTEHWVTFPSAFVNTPLCCPSRATLLTGRYAHHHGVLTNEDGARLDEATTVAAWLDAAGYHTGLVGKYLNAYPFGRSSFVPAGWDEWWGKAQGPATSLYYDYTLIEQGAAVRFGDAPEDYLTDVLADRAVGFIRDAPEDEPFFLWFAPTAPHPPWVPAPRHVGAFAGLPISSPPSVGEADVSDKPAWVRVLPEIDPAKRATLLEQHRESFETLLAVDDAIRSIVGALRTRGDLERTVIAFVSDNGYSFGEHRWIAKRCPYDECTGVPFLVRYPPVQGRVEPALVSAVDLAPTIAELAGVAPPAFVDGTSLVPVLEGHEGGSGTVYSEWVGDADIPAWWQLRTSTFAYIELGTGERELYDLRADPYELENAIHDSAYASVVERFAVALERFRAS